MYRFITCKGGINLWRVVFYFYTSNNEAFLVGFTNKRDRTIKKKPQNLLALGQNI